MPLPKVVYLGAADYDIKEKKHLDLLGETDNNLSVIKLRSTQSEVCKRDTFLHEILHAVMWLSGARSVFEMDHDDEESIIRVLTPWLLAFLRDNPDALEYLLEK